MTKFKTDIDAMTDKEKQALVMKEYEMAKAAMDANDMATCQTHMDDGGKGMAG
ncbi:MAG TPA: hypothetical protein VMZ01_04190 [Aestuariivirga sp.]|nr:hypothetical protein [Aestuariivirga sp.]